MQASNYKENKLFGGIPNSRNVLFLQIFQKRAAKPSAGNPVGTWPGPAPKIPPKPSPGPSLQPSPGPVEPDLALHQGFPRASPEPFPEPCWTWPGSAPKPPGTFSGTFSGTLLNQLNLTWLCTRFPEPCWTWPVSAPNPKPFREPSEPSPEPRWTWPGACTSAHRSNILG